MSDPIELPTPPALLEVLEESRRFGFLGPGPVGPQVHHADGFVAAAGGEPDSFLDLGSGGGLPGLVLAVRWPGARGVLLDSMVRRTEFLAEAVERLGAAGRVRVVCARAEDAARTDLRGSFALVTARSFGPPSATAECATGLLRAGGLLVVSEPPTADPSRWDAAGLEDLGLALEGEAGTDARFVCIRKVGDHERWPRRSGVPTKRPLWS